MYPDFKYVIAYAICIIAVLIIYILRTKRFFNLSFFLLVWWTISGLASCLFYFFYSPVLDKLNPQAIAYYVVGFLIIVYPLFNFDECRLKTIEVNSYLPIIRKVALLFGLLSIFPLIENVFFIFSHSSLDFFADQHKMLNTGELESHLSFFSEKLHNFCSHFADLFGLILCALLVHFRSNQKYILFLLLAILEQVANCVANGSRGYIVYMIILVAVSYKLFYNQYNVVFRNRINKYASVGFLAIVSLLSALTSVRVADSDVSYLNATEDQAQLVSNSLYLGEAPVRLASYGWTLKAHTNGHSLFDTVVTIIDGVKFKNSDERRNWVTKKTGIQYPQVFYGLVGFSYIDFGYWGLIVLLLFNYVFRRYLLFKEHTTFPKLIICVIMIKILIFATMVFPYCYSKFYDLIYMYGLFLILNRKKLSYG